MGISLPIQTASLGMTDSLILLVLALVVFGPRRLPQIGRQLGKLMYEFRKASNDFKFQMEEELRKAEDAERLKTEEAARQRSLAATQDAAALAQNAAQQALDAASQAQSAAQTVQTAVAAPQTNPEPATTPAEEGLQVQPPAIGEQVAAERPGSVTAGESASQESTTRHD